MTGVQTCALPISGSTEVAKAINRTLAARDDNPVLIAETGGQNAMIIDSTALAEQVCADVLTSAFDSAGQRCSALRILCVQEDVADRTITMIKGAMDELRVDNPAKLATDIGPVIDKEAQQNLLAHIENMKKEAKAWHQSKLSADIDPENSTFVPPTLLELEKLDQLTRENFGPVLHVLRYKGGQLDSLIEQINSKGYALTGGIHSRIDGAIEHISQRLEAGNLYVNRNIVGAVVGVQPFGGHSKSGTGPKAGGQNYLQRLTRGGHWQAPATTTAGSADEAALSQILDAVKQSDLTSEAKTRLQKIADDARKNTLRHAIERLGGPTGETNENRWHMPTTIALYGGDLEQSLAVLIPIAAAGGRAAVNSGHPLAAWKNRLGGIIHISQGNICGKATHVIALSPLPAEEKTALAARDGVIIKIQPADADGNVDILPLYHENSRSTNTTAAGGNASLMAMAEV